MIVRAASLLVFLVMVFLMTLAPAAAAEPPAAASALDAPLESVRELLNAGRNAEAEAAARELLARVAPAEGPDTADVARVLDAVTVVLTRGGKAAEAVPFGERAVAAKERIFDARGPELARSLHVLGATYASAGDAAAARAAHERALVLREEALGPDHVDVAASLQAMGELLVRAQELPAARAVLERALAIREKALGPDHLDVGISANSLGIVHLNAGRPADAARLFERVLALREKALAPDHVSVVHALSNVAAAWSDGGNIAAARPLKERVLAVQEKRLGPAHPEVADALDSLAFTLMNLGDYAGAKPLVERALQIREEVLGPDHPDVAESLDTLAALLTRMRSHAAARPLMERAVAILEKALGPEHPAVASKLNNLAILLEETGDVPGAVAAYQRAIGIRESMLGPDHPDLAYSLNNLGTLLHEADDLVGARRLYERALAIREAALGPDHPDVAESVNNLAKLLERTGELRRADALHERALATWEKAHGPHHPDVALSLDNRARLACALGEPARALDLALRADGISREHVRLTSRVLGAAQAQDYSTLRTSGLHVAVSVAVDGREASAPARALDAVTRSRALALDELAARRRDVQRSMDPRVGSLAKAHASATERVAAIVMRGRAEDALLLEDALKEQGRTESELAAQSLPFRADQARAGVGLAEVAAALPRGDALVAFLRYFRRPLAASGAARADGPPADSVASYVAFVLRGGDGAPSAVPLGAAAVLDELVARWRREVAKPDGSEAACREAGEALRRAAWDPLSLHVEGAGRVFVVPDGALHFVSFAALPTGEDGYVVESGPLVHVLSAERDLVRPPAASRGDGLFALGGPAFDAAVSVASLRPRATKASPLRGETSQCSDFRSLRFEPLPGAELEAQDVGALWRSAARDETAATSGRVLAGARATEAAVKTGAPGSRVLHLATHGFFLDGTCSEEAEGTRAVTAAAEASSESAPASLVRNPLLRSGLALSSANHRDAAGPGHEDGILTAEEIAALDLSGVEWAVLSACDTGLGDIQSGEGVLGLRRAFQIAGARTVIMSLWSVGDDATRQWMTELYQARLERGLETSASVREASRSVLRARRAKNLSTHPFHWAGFVAAGDWS